jgi:hypothetical protein
MERNIVDKLVDKSKWSLMINGEDDSLHVFPPDDVVEHFASWYCECRPYVDKRSQSDYEKGYSDRLVWHHRYIKDGDYHA